jgi:hypothetical protein
MVHPILSNWLPTQATSHLSRGSFSEWQDYSPPDAAAAIEGEIASTEPQQLSWRSPRAAWPRGCRRAPSPLEAAAFPSLSQQLAKVLQRRQIRRPILALAFTMRQMKSAEQRRAII